MHCFILIMCSIDQFGLVLSVLFSLQWSIFFSLQWPWRVWRGFLHLLSFLSFSFQAFSQQLWNPTSNWLVLWTALRLCSEMTKEQRNGTEETESEWTFGQTDNTDWKRANRDPRRTYLSASWCLYRTKCRYGISRWGLIQEKWTKQHPAPTISTKCKILPNSAGWSTELSCVWINWHVHVTGY